MKNKDKVIPVTGLRMYFGWFGLLTPVFGAGMLVGVGLLSALTPVFIAQVVVASVINYFVGRHLLKPVVAEKKEKRVKYAH